MHFSLLGVNKALSVPFYLIFKKWDWLTLEMIHLSTNLQICWHMNECMSSYT